MSSSDHNLNQSSSSFTSILDEEEENKKYSPGGGVAFSTEGDGVTPLPAHENAFLTAADVEDLQVSEECPSPAQVAQAASVAENIAAAAAASAEAAADAGSDEKDGDKDAKKKKNRCATCRKKVGLTGFECRCGGLFCAVHRYSDKHDCSFNYREMGAQEIRRNNPVVVGEKIQKI